MERTSRILYCVAGLLLLLALALRIAPASAPPIESAATEVPPPNIDSGESKAGQPGTSVVTIVEGNVFSSSRSAPRVRFIPPDLAPAEPALVRRRDTPGDGLRLFGTVVSTSGTAALIDADPAVRGAEIYEVGDVVRGSRIVAVSESTVVLEGATGRAVLRLQPTPQPTR